MMYNFDEDVAKEVGVEEAMMLSNIEWWVEKMLQITNIITKTIIGRITHKKHFKNSLLFGAGGKFKEY